MSNARLRLTRLLKPYAPQLLLAFLAMLVEGTADLLEPWPLKVVFDYIIGTKPAPAWLSHLPFAGSDRLTLLNIAAASVILIAGVGALGSYGEKYLSATAGQRVMHDLRHLLYHHVQRLSLSFHDRQRTGDMVVRLTSDIDAAQDFVSTVLLGIMLDVLTLVGMLGVMLYLDWRFTLIALSVAPLLFGVVYGLTRRIKNAAREMKRKESELTSVVQESMSSMRIVKAFAAERYEEQRLEERSLESVDTALRARSIKATLSPLVDLIVAVGTGVVLLVGVRMVLSGSITSGSLLVFVLYLGRMYKPMKDLSKMTDSLSKAVIGFERINELLDTDAQIRNRPGARAAKRFEGRIEFKDVSFRYGDEQPVLTALNLTIEPGQTAAIVGPTGTGKSTLIALIARLYDVTSGAVLVDGTDVRDYTLRSLRDQVSFVLQDTTLLRAPVWQNIAYGRPDATRDQIIAAAKAANAHEFIEKMPDGYDTMIGERGDTLSGGQRQRIAIARALIRPTRILLLDEPSAALDPQAEELVLGALDELMKDRTTITIAHRLSTIRNADVIFVMDDGRIVEHGTHDELMARGGMYAELHNTQFAEGAHADPVLVPQAVATA